MWLSQKSYVYLKRVFSKNRQILGESTNFKIDNDAILELSLNNFLYI